jgi:hypothetical protein
MKKAILAFVGITIVALAIAVGKQMSSDAMAVIVGIVCGIGASIPTSLLMLMLTRRREPERQEPAHGTPQMPSIMIVNPAGGYGAPYQPSANQYLPPAYGASMPRQFQIVGADAQDDQSFFGA